MKSILTFLVAAIVACTTVSAQTKHKISETSLLKEMTDRDEIARVSVPSYTTAQFSSYDRASVSSDRAGWYANGDYSMFIRSEKVDGHVEHVMMEDFGPGAIVRFWTTLAGGENGIIRIYLDGSDDPVLEAPAFDLLGSDVVAAYPFSASVSPLTPKEKRGYNLYYPIPYATSCKVTYQRSTTGNGNIYYNIECRKYGEDVEVQSYTGAKDKKLKAAVLHASDKLVNDPVFKSRPRNFDARLNPEDETGLTINGMRAIEKICLRINAQDMSQALRSTVIQMTFDGEQTVWAPIGDFFGTGYSQVHHRTFYNEAEPDGTLTCYWIMPFRQDCSIVIKNLGAQTVSVKGEIVDKEWKWDDRSMHFCAVWSQHYDAKTGTMGRSMPQDINFVHIDGTGKYMGDALAVFNTSGSWWGEGDEKIYVDGETFPSHFGTGTEDYYGYAWCEPGVFSDHPFIGLPAGSGNLGIGCTVNNRYRSLDAIPFEKSLDVNVELFEWDDERVVYAPVSFWYMKPGGKFNIVPDEKEARRKVVLKREEFLKPVLTSYIEGEDMIVESCDADYHVQYLGHPAWSYKTILFMSKAHKGDRIVASFDSPYEAMVRADVIMAMAGDYGVVNVYFNGEKIVEAEDLKYYEISSKTVPAGEILLKKGRNVVVLEIESQPEGQTECVAGIDRIAFYPL